MNPKKQDPSLKDPKLHRTPNSWELPVPSSRDRALQEGSRGSRGQPAVYARKLEYDRPLIPGKRTLRPQITQSRSYLYTLGHKVGIIYILGALGEGRKTGRNHPRDQCCNFLECTVLWAERACTQNKW